VLAVVALELGGLGNLEGDTLPRSRDGAGASGGVVVADFS
jgi:hypothetical protein